jgi:protein-tyrosine phosphatase
MAETATTPEADQPTGMIIGGAAMHGVFNFRDLGGPVGSAGTALRPGFVFRADGIHRTDAEGKSRLLLATGLRQVVDLRTDKELEQDGRFEHPDVERRHLPIVEDLRELGAAPDAEDLLRYHYVGMANKNGATFAAALHAVADALDAGRPVLYHCTAGKDRTGMLTALLLSGLGLDDSVVADDYARSAHGMRAMIDWFRRSGQASPDQRMREMGLDPSIAGQLVAAKRETMLGTLQDLRAEHSTIEGFLKSLDATDAVARIGKHILVDPAD